MLYTRKFAQKLLQSACAFFFFNDTATTEIYTLSLHDALPISFATPYQPGTIRRSGDPWCFVRGSPLSRSEEHTSELQSQSNLVCRLLLEKKNRSKRLKPGCHPRSLLPGQACWISGRLMLAMFQ